MRSAKTFVILLLVTVVVAVVAFLYRDQSVQTALSGEPLFPDLLGGINDTAEFTLQSGGASTTFKPKDGQWGIVQRGGYPADQEGVRKLLLGLAQLKRVESKTSNPDRYEEIGLEDPDAEDSSAVRITVTDAAGSKSADVIVGDRKLGRGEQALEQLFVRLPDDPQSWLVEGSLPDRTDLSEWLDIEILTLEDDRIRQVRISRPDGEKWVVSRGDASQPNYALEGLGEDETMKPSYEVNSVATTFAELELDDVQKLEEGKEYPEPQLTATMETFDGLVVSMAILELDGKRLARLNAERQPVEVVDSESETEAKPDDSAKSPADEAAALNERWQGWLFEVAEYQLDAIAKRRSDLLEPPAAEDDQLEDKPEGES